jgi:hypothetical protein
MMGQLHNQTRFYRNVNRESAHLACDDFISLYILGLREYMLVPGLHRSYQGCSFNIESAFLCHNTKSESIDINYWHA